MLDRKFIIENLDAVKANCRNRGVTAEVDQLAKLEASRREKLVLLEQFNRQANEVSKSIGQAKDAAERDQRKEEGRRLRDAKDVAQAEHDQIDAQVHQIQLTVPNMAHPDAPVGRDDQANLEVSRGKTQVRKFDFKPLDHLQLGEKWDWIDFEGGLEQPARDFISSRANWCCSIWHCSNGPFAN